MQNVDIKSGTSLDTSFDPNYKALQEALREFRKHQEMLKAKGVEPPITDWDRMSKCKVNISLLC